MPGKKKMGKGKATRKLPVKKSAGTPDTSYPESSSSETLSFYMIMCRIIFA